MNQELSITELVECYKRKIEAFDYLVRIWQHKSDQRKEQRERINIMIVRMADSCHRATCKLDQYKWAAAVLKKDRMFETQIRWIVENNIELLDKQ